MGVKDVSARWLKRSKAYEEERPDLWAEAGLEAKKHSSEAFYALYDPLEAAVFSVLMEMLKEMDKADCENEIDFTFLRQACANMLESCPK